MKLFKLTSLVAVLSAITAHSAFAEVGKNSFAETSNFKCERLEAAELKKAERVAQKDNGNSAVRQEPISDVKSAM